MFRDDRGTVIIMATILMTVLLGFAALSIDMGMVMTARTELQNVADAAAYAGIARLAQYDYMGAIEESLRFGNSNTVLGKNNTLSPCDIELGQYDFDRQQFTFSPCGCGNAIRVTARRTSNSLQGAIPLVFGRILGKPSVNTEATAIAVVDRRITGFDGSLDGVLLPFTVDESVVGSPPVIGTSFKLYDHTQQAAGNFGLLDLTGQCGAVPTPVLRNWIDNGYPSLIELSNDGTLQLEGCPGFRNTLRSNVAGRIGETVVIFINNSCTGQGSKAIYNIIGLLAVKILSVEGNGKHLDIQAMVVGYASPGFKIGPSCHYYSPSVGKTYLIR